jgi:hypothetical protein
MTHASIFEKVFAALAASLLLAGCYTQTGSVREESEAPAEGYTDSRAAYDTTAADSGAYSDDSYESSRRHFYYDSYYPVVAVGVGFYDAWWYGYYPWYASVYWSWPYYGWGYYGAYYPYYGWGYYGGYYPYHPYHDGYAPYYATAYARTRTFGTTRGGGSTRGGSPAYGGRSVPSVSAGVRPAARLGGRGAETRVSTARGPARTSRLSPAAGSQSARRQVDRGNIREGWRSSVPRSRLNAPSSSGGSRGGERVSSGRSTSPPPSSGRSGGAPASSGGRAPSSGGSRGGGSRR